jgi:hypothetical protein
MRVQVLSRSAISLNIIMFIIFSLFFFHTEIALLNQLSAFNVNLIKINVMDFKHVFLMGITTIGLIWGAKKVSTYTFSMFILLILIESVNILRVDFNKPILILLCFFLVLSFYYYLLLTNELQQPYLNTNYRKSDMFEPVLLKIPARVVFRDGKELLGHLVNWNENGVFLKLDEKVDIWDNKVKLVIDYKGREFSEVAKLVSVVKNKDGFGLRFISNSEKTNEFSWYNFYKILDDMGFEPEYLR